MRLLLATGMEGLESDLKPLLKSRGIEFCECYHRIALIDTAKKNNVDAVLVSRNLNGNADLIKLIDILAGGKVTVFALPGAETMSDAEEFVVETVLLGVNNYIYDPPDPEKILDYLEHPRTRHDVKKEWLEEAMRREKEKASRGRGITEGIGDLPVTGKKSSRGILGLLGKKEANQNPPPKDEEDPPKARKRPTVPKAADRAGRDIKHPNKPSPTIRPSEAIPEGFIALGRVDGVSSRATRNTIQEVVAAKPRAVLVPDTEAVKDLCRERTLASTPIVVVGSENPSLCYRAGADVCVSALDSKSVELILDRAAGREVMWSQADRDSLTQCYSRDFLDLYVKTEQKPCSVLMCDLDHFKGINDTFGHGAGDEVLRQFGRFLRSSVRETDIAARYGGEEFVVIFPLSDNGIHRANAICQGWASRRITLPGGQTIKSTFSGGFTTGTGNLTGLIEIADQAMYRAKRTGRNRVVIAGDQAALNESLDRVVDMARNYTVAAYLEKESFYGYRVTDARGPFAGQLIDESVELIARDGVNLHSGNHWLFGLSGQTILLKQDDKAILIGKRGRFEKSEINKFTKFLEGVL